MGNKEFTATATVDRWMADRFASAEPDRLVVRARVRAKLLGIVEERPRIGRFEIVARIGRGAMATVYEAIDTKLGRTVALKRMVADDERTRQRVLDEARAQAAIAHPNLVTIYDAEIEGETATIAMELVPGDDLRRWLGAGARSVRDVAQVLLGAARGLAATHRAGLVHGDFKPDNVLVGRDGRARVADFGLARLDLDEGTARGGTPAYMAPELWRGEVATAKSDQFAWCTSLYEACYGERPVRARNDLEIAAALKELRVAKRGSIGRIPRWLRDVIARGLAPLPSQRFASMDAVVTRLERGLGRRRQTIAAGIAAVSVAAVVGILVGRSPAPAECDGGGAKFEQVWSPARAGALRSVFARAGGDGVAAFGAVASQLDSYRVRWTGLHRAACVAARVEGTQSAALLDLRMQCLARRLDAVRAFVDESTAGTVPVARAARIAEALPPIEACDDVTDLREPPPPSSSIAAAVAALQQRLVRLDVLRQAGRLDTAETEARKIVTAATELGYPRLRGEALVVLGNIQYDRQDPAGARETFQAAMSAAAQAGDDARLREAALELFALESAEDRVDVALALASLLRPLLHDVKSPRLWANFHRSEGMVLGTKNDYAGALAAFDLALRLLAHENVPAAIARLHLDKAYTLSSAGRYAEALTALEQAESIIDHTAGAYVPDRIEVMIQHGFALQQLGRPDEAIAILESCLTLSERVHGANNPAVAQTLLALGDTLRSAGRVAEAVPLLERAVEILSRAGDSHRIELADATVRLGTARSAAGDFDKARAALEKALALYTTTVGLDDRRVINTINSIGNVLRGQGRLDEARGYYERALAGWERTLGPSHAQVAIALTNLGELALVARRWDEARRRCERGLAIDEATHDKDHPDLAYGLTCLGEADLGAGNVAAALPRLERAVALWEATPGNKVDQARSEFALARALAQSGATEARAVAKARQAQALFREAGDAGARERVAVDRWLAGRRNFFGIKSAARSPSPS